MQVSLLRYRIPVSAESQSLVCSVPGCRMRTTAAVV